MIKIIKNLSKRAKFVIVTLLQAGGFFAFLYFDADSRLISYIILSLTASLSLFLILLDDLKLGPQLLLLVLPLFYTLAFGLFYSLLPARFLTRLILTSFYGVGLYALYLSHNIYAVAGARTIQLLKAAHSVGFLLTVLTHFFLMNVIFSLHLVTPLVLGLVLLLSFSLILPIMWSVTLEEYLSKQVTVFSAMLALVIGQLSLMLSFWPAHPTVGALFLSGNFYTYVGLSQAWLERRLFKNTLWEFVGVAIIVLLVLITFTKWGE